MEIIGVGISGGAFYLRAQAAALYTVFSVYGKQPQYYIGTSAGAIISAVTAVLGVQKMWQFAASINPTQAINGNPFNKNGGLTLSAKMRILRGWAPVKQSIIPILNTLISQKEWDTWRANRLSPLCFVTTCNIDTGERHTWDLKRYEREKAFLIIEASARMQGLTEPVLIDGHLHWDGGQIDHNPAHVLADLPIPFSEFISIWARPKEWNAEDMPMVDSGLVQRLFRMIDIDNIEKSINDEYKLKSICRDKNIPLKNIYIPRVLANYYDASPEGQRRAVNAAILATHETFS